MAVPDTWCLKDNWVIPDETIRLYLYYMTEQEYRYVSENRTKYPECVQSIIAEYDGIPLQKFNKSLKVRDVSDYEMYNREKERKLKIIERARHEWIIYKHAHKNLTRPMSFNDLLMQKVGNSIAKKNREIDETVVKITDSLKKKYGSVLKRNEVARNDPSLDPLRAEVTFLKNELSLLTSKWCQEENEWEESVIYEYAINCMLDV